MKAPRHRYEVRDGGTVLPFAEFTPAHAEWAHRCHEGRKAQLWQYFDETAEADAGWDCVLIASEYDDMRDEQIRRFDDEHEALLEAVR